MYGFSCFSNTYKLLYDLYNLCFSMVVGVVVVGVVVVVAVVVVVVVVVVVGSITHCKR